MHIYIEREFLDNFYLDYNEQKASGVQKIVYSLLTEYPETKWFIDSEDLEQLKQENEIFAKKANYFMPIPISSIKEYLFEKQDFKQTVVFTQDGKDWFTDIENRGVLCFDFDTYENRISKIIENCGYKRDLSEVFDSWNSISTNIPFNKVVINDSYILCDKSNQKIDKNLLPLLKVLLKEKENNKIDVEIYTNDLNPTSNSPEKIKEEAKKRLGRLNSVFANYKVKFKIVNNFSDIFGLGKYDFHDRIIYNNFQIIECGKGFNLIPYKKSNSQIISESIFELYTYKRLKNLLKMHEEYFSTLERKETDNFTYI